MAVAGRAYVAAERFADAEFVRVGVADEDDGGAAAATTATAAVGWEEGAEGRVVGVEGVWGDLGVLVGWVEGHGLRVDVLF